MLDLLDLRGLTNESVQDPFGAATCGYDERLGRENDLLAGGRGTHRNRLDPLAAPTWRGVTTKNPVLVALAQYLHKAALREAAVSPSHRRFTERRGESGRQRSSRQARGDWEAGRPGRSYTVDTLRAFRKLRPADDPFLILGWDAARDLRTWRKPEEVLRLARLVVVGRPGLDSPTPEGLRLAGIDPQQAILCMQPTPDVAATTVRRLAATGEPLEDLVPGVVEDYIRERGLYPDQRS